jgi:hypothetical protein
MFTVQLALGRPTAARSLSVSLGPVHPYQVGAASRSSSRGGYARAVCDTRVLVCHSPPPPAAAAAAGTGTGLEQAAASMMSHIGDPFQPVGVSQTAIGASKIDTLFNGQRLVTEVRLQ